MVISLLRWKDAVKCQGLELEADSVQFYLAAKGAMAYNPLCGCAASRIHSRYSRKLAVLPWAGRPVQVTLRARRFFCKKEQCHHKTFAERLATAPAYARKAAGLQEQLVPLAADRWQQSRTWAMLFAGCPGSKIRLYGPLPNYWPNKFRIAYLTLRKLPKPMAQAFACLLPLRKAPRRFKDVKKTIFNGYSLRAIARMLKLCRQTVTRYQDFDQYAVRRQPPAQPSKVLPCNLYNSCYRAWLNKGGNSTWVPGSDHPDALPATSRQLPA